MPNNVKYAFVGNDDGGLCLESTVQSFGLEHVTQKDLESFYMQFSSKAYFDTGLLPVDGSGMLSIRTSGDHVQIGYQHKPGMYYINWGQYEGDANAAKIYVAQPYRIVIADIYQGNLLGARTFYSPIPVQHPSTLLYHVNLPNINCKGYRGNGVGWICLYHTHDTSHYPFSEKVAHILDRCSGTEAYNDANMSETDGPRFYAQNGKPAYITNPQEWERYSEQNGVDWTLNPDLWIPVLVSGIDNQGEHVPGGQPLTYADAILGNYQAYYEDPIKPKPVNALVRNDLKLQKNELFNWFKVAYNAAMVHGTALVKKNPFSDAEAVRTQHSEQAPVFTGGEEDPNFNNGAMSEDCYICEDCSNEFDPQEEGITSHWGYQICGNCSSNYVFVDHMGSYFYHEDENLAFFPYTEQYVHLPDWPEHVECDQCGQAHVYDSSLGYFASSTPLYYSEDENGEKFQLCCSACVGMYGQTACYMCLKEMVISNDANDTYTYSIYDPVLKQSFHVCNSCYTLKTSYPQRMGAELENTVTCVCGNDSLVGDLYTLPAPYTWAFPLKPDIPMFVKNEGIVAPLIDLIETGDAWPLVNNLKDYAGTSISATTHYFSVSVDKLCPSCIDKESLQFSSQTREYLITDFIKNLVEQGKTHQLYGTSIVMLPYSKSI